MRIITKRREIRLSRRDKGRDSKTEERCEGVKSREELKELKNGEKGEGK